jgi:hypothetical protein
MTVTTGARGSCLGLVRGLFFLGEGFRVVELGGQRLVAHLLDDDHRRLLVELLVDGDHLAQLHQLLDDLAGLDDILCARSATEMVSGTCTSCTCCSAGA